MIKIASQVYENLKPRQRIIASIEAAARDDEAEISRLNTSCPRKMYTKNDIEYSGTLEKLMGVAMAVECDLRGFALSFYFALRIDPTTAGKFLQEYADTRAAWKSAVSEMGIDPEAMKKAGPPPSPILELIDGIFPIPNQENTKMLSGEISKLIKLRQVRV